jgi:hypothetical protein
MTQIILQPAGDAHARQHYVDTIATPVSFAVLAPHLTDADMSALRSIYGERPVPTWGVTPGGRDVNRRKWERITPGDVVLMVRDGEAFVSGAVTYTTHNEALAEELWGRDEDGATWEYLYFLDNLEAQTIPIADINVAAGYEPNNRVQGFNVLDQDKSDRIVAALNLGAASTPDARAYLRSLIGRTIPTLTGRPNTILDVGERDVVVGTERSSDGQPVPIEWVQDAMERFQRDGEVDISVDSVGHRSAFVGAVLASLPGTRAELDPRRVVLSDRREPLSQQRARRWREPPEVATALDVVAELAAHGAARRPGTRQSAAQRRAIEVLAVEHATAHFERQGWSVEYVGSVASFDLDCRKDDRTLHVEVKGTTSAGDKILLTRNEVRHARETDAATALFVLRGIRLSGGTEDPTADGGDALILHPWELREDSLEPIGYEYVIPDQ